MQICGRRAYSQEVVTLTGSDGRIESIVSGTHEGGVGGADLWLAPGFCDVQLNGYAGRDFNIAVWGQRGGIEPALYDLRDLLAAAGTALFCPTITTNSQAAICESLAAIARALDADPALARSIPGIHVEGPFIAPEDGP